MTDSSISRRSFLAASAAGAAAGLLVPATRAAASTSALPADPFTVGVASGDVLPGAVVIWTRLTTAPTQPGLGMDGQGPIPVEWRMAATAADLDDGPLSSGTALALPEQGWSVHVDVTGLHPDSTYYYRFSTQGWTSPVGRTRTAPTPPTDRALRFATISCQNLAMPGNGIFYFNGVSDIAARDDLDFVVHLGDYIYEFGRPGHIPGRALVSLDDYRRRYGQYKSTDSLRAMHARLPIYAVPDDHEFFDGVFGGDPDISDANRQRFDNALQAYWENMPVRTGPPQFDEASGRLRLTLHRHIKWGANLDLFLVDDRQYRTLDSTILGTEQLAWLTDSLAGSHATWTAVGSGVPVAWFPDFAGAADKWTGYDADRSALTDAFAARLASRPRRAFNPVVLSGDIHRGLVTHVRQRQNDGSPLVATEFVGPPMTSNSGTDFAAHADAGAFRVQYAYESGGALQAYRGYLDCEVTAASWTTGYVLGNQMDRPDGTVRTFDRWRLAADAPVGSVERL